MVMGLVGDVLGALGPEEGDYYPRRRRGRPGTKTGMIAMPARMPTARQWKKINSRLHEYGIVARGVLRRQGYDFRRGPRGSSGGYRRTYKRQRR